MRARFAASSFGCAAAPPEALTRTRGELFATGGTGFSGAIDVVSRPPSAHAQRSP